MPSDSTSPFTPSVLVASRMEILLNWRGVKRNVNIYLQYFSCSCGDAFTKKENISHHTDKKYRNYTFELYRIYREKLMT